MRSSKLRLLCQTALFAAVIYVFTAYLHIPSFYGYTHIGDGFIYLAASFLPMGWAAAAGAVGAGLSDLLSGYAIWAPGTVIIKALTACCFTSKHTTFLCKRNYFALIPAFVLCVGGYYLYDALITGNFVAPLADVPGDLMQVIFSSILYLVLGKIMDRGNLKQRLDPRRNSF